eukprot:265315-Rhodomonas_salina.1
MRDEVRERERARASERGRERERERERAGAGSEREREHSHTHPLERPTRYQQYTPTHQPPTHIPTPTHITLQQHIIIIIIIRQSQVGAVRGVRTLLLEAGDRVQRAVQRVAERHHVPHSALAHDVVLAPHKRVPVAEHGVARLRARTHRVRTARGRARR